MKKRESTLSAAYVRWPDVPYHNAVQRLAVKIKYSRPAVDDGDPVPVFTLASCARIIACAYGVGVEDVLKDLEELTKRV